MNEARSFGAEHFERAHALYADADAGVRDSDTTRPTSWKLTRDDRVLACEGLRDQVVVRNREKGTDRCRTVTVACGPGAHCSE